MLVISTFYRLKQEDLQYEAILEYIARLKRRKKKRLEKDWRLAAGHGGAYL